MSVLPLGGVERPCCVGSLCIPNHHNNEESSKVKLGGQKFRVSVNILIGIPNSYGRQLLG